MNHLLEGRGFRGGVQFVAQYDAASVCVPEESLGSVNWAEPAESVACASSVEPSFNWTTPVGATEEALDTFVLRITARPRMAGLAVEANVVLIPRIPPCQCR